MTNLEFYDQFNHTVYALMAIQDLLAGSKQNDTINCGNLYFLIQLITDKQTELLELQAASKPKA